MPDEHVNRELLHLAVRDIDYEIGQLMDLAHETRRNGSGPIGLACLESALLHVRNALDFLDSGKKGYITVRDYLPKWSPQKSGALKRLRAERSVLNGHLSHLTWDRVTKRNEAGDNPAWNVGELADDVLSVFTDFVAQLQRIDAEAAEWFSGTLACASIALRGTWPEILPTPASGSPLSLYTRSLKRRRKAEREPRSGQALLGRHR
jgi:hypothetical protein